MIGTGTESTGLPCLTNQIEDRHQLRPDGRNGAKDRVRTGPLRLISLRSGHLPGRAHPPPGLPAARRINRRGGVSTGLERRSPGRRRVQIRRCSMKRGNSSVHPTMGDWGSAAMRRSHPERWQRLLLAGWVVSIESPLDAQITPSADRDPRLHYAGPGRRSDDLGGWIPTSRPLGARNGARG